MSEGDDDAPEHLPEMSEWFLPKREDNHRSSSSGKRRRGHGKLQECWTEPHISRVSWIHRGRGIFLTLGARAGRGQCRNYLVKNAKLMSWRRGATVR